LLLLACWYALLSHVLPLLLLLLLLLLASLQPLLWPLLLAPWDPICPMQGLICLQQGHHNCC
jgi:hypothetical protein